MEGDLNSKFQHCNGGVEGDLNSKFPPKYKIQNTKSFVRDCSFVSAITRKSMVSEISVLSERNLFRIESIFRFPIMSPFLLVNLMLFKLVKASSFSFDSLETGLVRVLISFSEREFTELQLLIR